MKFQEYKEAVKVTLKDMGTKQANNNHMVMGFMGEIGEVLLALRRKDLVNLGEELSDQTWFCTNYGNINDLKEPMSVGVLKIEGYIDIPFWKRVLTKIDKGLLWCAGRSTPLKYPLQFEVEFDTLTILMSSLNDLEKRSYAYGKPQRDESRSDLLKDIFRALSWCYFYAGIDPEVAMQNNIDKLMVRYNKKKFDADQAVERNLSAERIELEKK